MNSAGSRVTLYLKEDAQDFLSEFKLKDVLGKYSQFIGHGGGQVFPIYVKVKKEVEAEEEEDDDEEDDDTETEADDDEEKEKKEKAPKEKKKTTVFEWEQVKKQSLFCFSDICIISSGKHVAKNFHSSARLSDYFYRLKLHSVWTSNESMI